MRAALTWARARVRRRAMYLREPVQVLREALQVGKQHFVIDAQAVEFLAQASLRAVRNPVAGELAGALVVERQARIRVIGEGSALPDHAMRMAGGKEHRHVLDLAQAVAPRVDGPLHLEDEQSTVCGLLGQRIVEHSEEQGDERIERPVEQARGQPVVRGLASVWSSLPSHADPGRIRVALVWRRRGRE